jgi:hypothetical protein
MFYARLLLKSSGALPGVKMMQNECPFDPVALKIVIDSILERARARLDASALVATERAGLVNQVQDVTANAEALNKCVELSRGASKDEPATIRMA